MSALSHTIAYRSRFIGLIASALLSMQVIASDGEQPKQLQQIVNAAVTPVMQQYQIPGMAVAITYQGQASYFNFGVASLAQQAPVTSDTIFELGSVSKTFNALLAGYAIDQGKIELTAHPSHYWPALKGSAIDNATMLQLATYSAGGLPLQFPDSVKDNADMLHYFQQWQPTTTMGEQRQYSNPSIALFGYLASRALGDDFSNLITNQLLPAFGLHHTYVEVPAAAQQQYAWGYNQQLQPVHVNPAVLDAEAYGIKSTATDMLRYVQLQLDPSTLAVAYQHAIATTQVGYYQLGKMQQGLGWEQYPHPVAESVLLEGNSSEMILQSRAVKPVASRITGARLFNKTSSTGGFGAYVVFVPEHQLGIVLLANRFYPNTARVEIATQIMAWFDQAIDQ